MKHKIISKEIVKAVKFFKKKKFIPLHEPKLNTDDLKIVEKCIKSTFVSSVSQFTNIFEKKLKNLTKSKYSIAVINGTSALQIAIKACGVKKGEEILIPNLNYIGSSNASIYCGAIPHYVDVESISFGIDTIKLEKYLEKTCLIKKNILINKFTKRIVKAVIPTHIFGNPAKIEHILKIAKRFHLKVIEDASECVGSYYRGKHLGTFGDAGVLSFNGNKIITTGGGGAIITNNQKIYNEAFNLSTINRKTNSGWNYDYRDIGYNYRLPGINSSLGISQLKKLAKLILKKKTIYLKYKKLFSNCRFFKLVQEPINTNSNHWLNTIFIFNSNIKLRDRVIIETNKMGAGIRPVWKLMHKIKHLSKYPKMNLSNSILLEKSLINLPSSPNLDDK